MKNVLVFQKLHTLTCRANFYLFHNFTESLLPEAIAKLSELKAMHRNSD